jgi:hypothetical protein
MPGDGKIEGSGGINKGRSGLPDQQQDKKTKKEAKIAQKTGITPAASKLVAKDVPKKIAGTGKGDDKFDKAKDDAILGVRKVIDFSSSDDSVQEFSDSDDDFSDSDDLPLPSYRKPPSRRELSRNFMRQSAENLLDRLADLAGFSMRGSVDVAILPKIEESHQQAGMASDLMTVGGDVSDILQQVATGLLLMNFTSKVADNIPSGEKSHAETFGGMTRASERVVNRSSMANNDDLKLLNTIGFQWLKGYSPNGGMGRLKLGEVNMDKPLTAEMVALLSEKKIKGLEVGETLDDCGISEHAVINAFGMRSDVPKELIIPQVEVNLRVPLTDDLIQKLKNAGVEKTLEKGKTLKECGVTALDIVNAFRSKENVPKELQMTWNSNWDSLFTPRTGVGFSDNPPVLSHEELSLKEAGISEEDLNSLFAPGEVPIEYRQGKVAGGDIDFSVKIDDNLMERIKSNQNLNKKVQGKIFKLEDMTIKQSRLSEPQIARLFAPKKVPEKYKKDGMINFELKLDTDLISRIKDKGLFEQVEKERNHIINDLRYKAERNNPKVKKELIAMLQFLEDCSTTHFDPDRNPTALKTASTQMLATLGQFMHDMVFDRDIKSGVLLKEAFVTEGVTTEEALQAVQKFDTDGRKNPLLAEVKNAAVLQAIYDEIHIEPSTTADNIKAIFLDRLKRVQIDKQLVATGKISGPELKILNEIKQLERLSKTGKATASEENSYEELISTHDALIEKYGKLFTEAKLTHEEIQRLDSLAEKLVNQFADSIREMETNLAHSNPRGRVKGDFSAKGKWRTEKLARAIRGTPGPNASVVNMGHRGDDRLIEQIGMDNIASIKKAYQDPETYDGLESGSPPITLNRGGTGLDSKIVKFFERPELLLQESIKENGYPTLESLGLSDELVLAVYGNDMSKVPEGVKTKETIRTTKKLTAKMIKVLRDTGFTSEVDENQLKEGKTLQDLGYTQTQIRNFYKSKIEDGALTEIPKILVEPAKIDVRQGIDQKTFAELKSKLAERMALTDEQELMYALSEDISGDLGLRSELSSELGEITVPFNQATGQKIPLKKFATDPSVKAIFDQYSVRTICSISGTTLDTMVGVVARDGAENVKNLLKPLLDHVKSAGLPELATRADIPNADDLSPEELKAAIVEKNRENYTSVNTGLNDTPEGRLTMQYISCIAVLMEAGGYHTAGEVVGGMFISARGLLETEEDNTNNDETRELFTKLVVDFSVHPEHYIAGIGPTEQDVDKLQLAAQDVQKIKSKLAKKGLRQCINSLKARKQKAAQLLK